MEKMVPNAYYMSREAGRLGPFLKSLYINRILHFSVLESDFLVMQLTNTLVLVATK